MELQFRALTLEDKEPMNKLFMEYPSRSCERCFANNYLWSEIYNLEVAYYEGSYAFRYISDEGHVTYAYPLGPIENDATIIRAMYADAKKRGEELIIDSVTPTRFAELEELFPGKFQIDYNEDYFDYVYDREKLATLTGKKYHGKRNHINKFKETYPQWRYEPMSDENREACLEMAQEWRILNGCEDDPDKEAEMCVTMNAIRNREALGLKGGVLYADDRVVAFTLGEAISHEMFCVHIEKAFADVQGAYPMINQQFVIHEAGDLPLINREEDMGEEGLRKAKESYHPVFLEKKGSVTLKDGEELA